MRRQTVILPEAVVVLTDRSLVTTVDALRQLPLPGSRPAARGKTTAACALCADERSKAHHATPLR
eukprot:355796-Chlamydomonas_euryale.AAC.3